MVADRVTATRSTLLPLKYSCRVAVNDCHHRQLIIITKPTLTSFYCPILSSCPTKLVIVHYIRIYGGKPPRTLYGNKTPPPRPRMVYVAINSNVVDT